MLVPVYKKIALSWLVMMSPGAPAPTMRYAVQYDQNHVMFSNAQETLTFSGEQIDTIVTNMPSDIQVNFVNGRWDWNRLADYVQDNNITPDSIVVPDQMQNNHQAPNNRAKQYHNNSDKKHYMVTVANVSGTKLHNLYSHRDLRALEKIRDELQSEIRWSYVTALFSPSIRKPMRQLLAQAEGYIQDLNDAFANKVHAITQHISDQNSSCLRIILSTGSRQALQNKKNKLLQEARSTWSATKQSYLYNKISEIEDLLSDPITELLFEVMTADLTQAQIVAESIQESWPWAGSEISPDRFQAKREAQRYAERLGFNELKAAQEILNVRSAQERPIKRNSVTKQKPSIEMDQDPIRFDDGLDMVPSVVSNWHYKKITPEIEKRFEQALNKYNTEGQNFEQYHADINKIVQDILPDVPEIFIERFVKRLHPSVQVERLAHLIPDLVNLVYHIGMEMAEHAMPKAYSASPEKVEGPVNSVMELVGGAVCFLAMDDYDRAQLLEHVDWQQISDFSADMSADILVDYALTLGIPELVSALKRVNYSNKINNAKSFAQKIASALAESVAEVPTAMTPEGITVKVGQEAEQSMSFFQKVKDKVVGSAQKVMTAEQTFLTQVVKDTLDGLRKELPKLESMFNNTRKGFAEFVNKWITIDYEHILGLQLKFTRRGIPKIGGLHHDFMNVIEKSGALEFANKIMHESGYYSIEARYLSNKVKDITFFPAHWSREKVMNTIFEAYDNFKKSGVAPALEANQKYKIESITSDGIKIRMFITKNGLITSAYPVLKVRG